jgi:dihydrolipoamide dehydrogenase
MWSGNTKGIEFLFKKNKITWLKGWGSRSPRRQGQGRRRPPRAKNIVIATGSEPSSLPGVTVDEKVVVVTSTGALALPRSRKAWS